ncbi:MAG: hypothetical protein WB580_06465, partial [Candidatus Binataceae bacterium]
MAHKHEISDTLRDFIKSRGLVCDGDRLGAVTAFEFVSANQASYGIATMCRTLGVSPTAITRGANGRRRNSLI